jgi:hypothetical protein
MRSLTVVFHPGPISGKNMETYLTEKKKEQIYQD